MEYKINIHAHSIFSDGINSPLAMAMKAKSLGFSALVITDHFYGDQFPDKGLNKDKFRTLRKASAEAKEILPIIVGIEVPFLGEEVLVFGGAAIRAILESGLPTKETMVELKKETGCAVILCHPSLPDKELCDIVDGFEEYNSGDNFFDNGNGLTRPFGDLEGKQRWCNSDAHSNGCLEKGYNIVDSKIENETDLIRYIKRGKQHKFFVKG